VKGSKANKKERWVTQMSKTISREQAIQGLFTLATKVDWDQIPVDVFQSIIDDKDRQTGSQFTAFLKNRGKLIIGEPKVIQIDRTQPFNLKKFLGDGWTIAEEDNNSLKLTELDLTKVQFKDMLKEGETSVNGEEKQKRLKEAGYTRLDAKIFQTLWENQELIPSSWKEPIDGNTRYIYFDGTILRDSDGDRFVLCLCWHGGEWRWSCSWLGID